MKTFTKIIFLLIVSFNLNAQQVIFSADDSLSFSSWTFFEVSQGADGYSWHLADVSAIPGMTSQGYVLQSNSLNPITPITPNDFAASPPIDLSSYTNAKLSWSAGSGSDVDFAEKYSVYVAYDSIPSDNMLPISDADIVHTETLSEGQQMKTHTIDISYLCGKNNVYVMFRHYDCTNQYFLVIDDVLVTTDPNLSISKLNTVKLTIYPVPAENTLTFECVEPIKKVTVLDVQGREVQMDFNVLTNQLNTSLLAKGMYSVVVRTESGKVVMEKFVK